MSATLINIPKRLPLQSTYGFTPELFDGTNQNPVTLNVYENEDGTCYTDLDPWSLLPFNWESWNAVYVDPTVSGAGTGTISDPYKSLDSAFNASVPTKTITGVANNGSGLSRVTATAHGFVTGDVVFIAAVTGATSVNGYQTVTRIDADTFDTPAAFSSSYVSGGTAALGKIVYAKPGLYNRAQSFKGRVINSNTVLLPWPGFTGQIIASSRLTNNTGGATIAADSTRGVWVFSDVRGEGSTTIATIYVASELPSDIANGVGRLYTLVGSIADCRTTPRSYHVVLDSSEIYTVYVNTGQTSSPDPNLLHILRDTANCAPVNGADSAHSFYVTGVKFLGGTRPSYVATTSGTTLVRSNYVFWDCEFCFSGVSAGRDGCAFSASKNIYLIDCLSHNVTRDCFSYKAFRDYTSAASFPSGTAVWSQAVEIRCRALNANTPFTVTDANSLANCSSAHDYCKIMRIGCQYELARGGIIHDTNTGGDYGVVSSVNIGCSAADSRAASDANAGVSDYCFGISGSSNVYAWVYRCVNIDSAGNNSDSTYYIRNKASTATVLVDSNLFNTSRKDGTLGAIPAFQTPR